MRLGAVAVVVAFAGAWGCGGGGSSSGVYATWRANGVPEAATPYRWEWNSDGLQDTFNLLAAGARASLQIVLGGPSPLPAGMYVCGQTPPQARMAYMGGGAQTATEAQTCSVTLTEVGTTADRPVTGTFEAMVADASGATTVLTDGSFGLRKTQ